MMTDTPQADALLTALISGEPQIEAFAELTEAHEREKALYVLLAILGDPSDALCLRAVMALSAMGDQQVVEPLLRLLDYLNEELNDELFYGTFKALIRFGDPEAIIPLLTRDVSENYWIKHGRMGQFDREVLLGALIDAANHADRHVRRGVVSALGWIDDPRAVRVLIRVVVMS